MPQFFLNKRLVILLVSIIVLVALIGFSLSGRKDVTWPEQFTKDTVGLVQATFHEPAQFVAGFFQNLDDLKGTYKENETLKSRLSQYMQLEANVSKLEDENEKLRTILKKKTSLDDYDPVQATVIARNPDRWDDVIVIDKGTNNGIQKDMAVITSAGLIGKVKNASAFTSTVQLLSSSERVNRISVIVQAGGKNAYGVVEGYDPDTKDLIVRRIPNTEKLKVGQKVISSGLGGIFPRGLLVGKVTKFEPDQYGLTQKAYVKPSTDLYDLDHVMVAKRSAVIPDDKTNIDGQEGGN
ncbi:rod shape-determining protein MreC [Priestia koreensis]|uniref:rod shape-determining protein MreC n=1 Tax=Priestia koreensis TaxID=284581 RepID=UPI00203DE618|nr:rod shape-determining protein MreC [Priestia koreensis]MCM3002645.1 rod shape-determining protein MreC [Priestia koreensis]